MPTVEELEAALANTRAELDTLNGRLKSVSDEAKGHRLNADNFRTRAEKADAEAEQARKEAEARVTEAGKKAEEAMSKAQQKGITADLRAAAREAGAVDVADVLALLDRSKVKVNADGDVENAEALLAEMKTAKPHLFGIKTTTSTRQPPAADSKPKSAKDMTAAEFDTELAKFGVRLG